MANFEAMRNASRRRKVPQTTRLAGGLSQPRRARRSFHVEDFQSRAAAAIALARSSLSAARVNDDGLSASRHRRQPSTQQRAIQRLRVLAQPHRLRVEPDAEGFPVIPGRYGQIEWFDENDLAVYTDRPRQFARLWAIPGVRRHQTGDTEMRAVFPPEALLKVARVIKARRRRTLSPEEARRRGFKPTHRATSGL